MKPNLTHMYTYKLQYQFINNKILIFIQILFFLLNKL